MSTNINEVFLIRIPAPIDKKALDGGVIDLNLSTANVAKNVTEESDEQISYVYEVDKNQSQENLNLIKLNKISETELKGDDSTQFCGYIQFRVKRNIVSDSEQFEPLPKRHVVEPIENYIKNANNDKSKSPKKKKKKKQRNQN